MGEIPAVAADGRGDMVLALKARGLELWLDPFDARGIGQSAHSGIYFERTSRTMLVASAYRYFIYE